MVKKSKLARVFAGLIIFCMFLGLSATLFTACGGNEKDSSAVLSVREIILDTSNAKLEFAYGEEFSAEGLRVIAKLSDGTETEVPLKSCRISKVRNTPGKRRVSVTYARKTKRYEVVFADKVMPPISSTPLVEIAGENAEAAYRVQAEDIDLAISGVQSAGGDLVVDDGSAVGGKYAANYGVAENYFGFTFTSDAAYSNATAVLRVANPSTEKSMTMSDMTVHLNYAGSNDNGALGTQNLAAIPSRTTDGLVWSNVVLRNLKIREGANTLTFNVVGENVPYLDYVDLYVGKHYSNRTVEVADAGERTTAEFEDLAWEKVITREDYMQAYGLNAGEICVLPQGAASGGEHVAALMGKSEASVLLHAEQDSTVQVILTAADNTAQKWSVAKDTEIRMDNEIVENIPESNLFKQDSDHPNTVFWKDSPVGVFDLTAGDHLLQIKINSPHALFDCVTVKTVSSGSFADHPDVYIDEAGTQSMEGEHLDPSDVWVREDFAELVIGQERGVVRKVNNKTASGGVYIDGFAGNTLSGDETQKSSFSFDFTLAKNGTVRLSMVAASYLGVNPSSRSEIVARLDGAVLSPEKKVLSSGWRNEKDFDWITVVLGKRNLAAGKHTFTIEILNFYFNLDCFTLETLSLGDYAPDVTVNGAGSYYAEAETLDPSEVVGDPHFVNAGRLSSATGEYCIDTLPGDHAGASVCGLYTGTKLRARFDLKENAVVRVWMRSKAGIGVQVDLQTHDKYYMDGLLATPAFQQTMSANGGNWMEFDLGQWRLKKGLHTFTIDMTQFSFNVDYLRFEVTGYGENDVVINDAIMGSDTAKTVTLEAEALDGSQVVYEKNGDGTNKFTPTEGYGMPVMGDIPVGTSGGKYVNGLYIGTKFDVKIDLAKKATVKIVVAVKAGIPVQIDKHDTFLLDGATLTLPSEGGLTSSFADRTVVTEKTLAAGAHTLSIDMSTFGFDFDCIKFVVSNYGAA